MRANDSVTYLKGVGPRVAERLIRLGIYNLQDLLFHLPLRYQDRTRIMPIAALRNGMEVVIEGEVLLSEVKYARRRMLLVRIADASGMVTLRFFHFSQTQQANLQAGRRIRCFGEVRYVSGNAEMAHPEYQFVDDGLSEIEGGQYLTPIYATTEGISQITLRNLIDQLVISSAELRLALPEYLDPALLKDFGFSDLSSAVAHCHKPPAGTSIEMLNNGKHPVQERLAFEELLAQHLSLKRLRRNQQHHRAESIACESGLTQDMANRLPFKLTAAQQRVLAEIETDLQKPYPMMRLVQGDVGSGKTVVAALAAMQVVEAGFQVVIMAPTEILAEQHAENFRRWAAPLNVHCGLLTGRQPAALKKTILEQAKSGQLQIIIGTHALFQDEVEFHNIGLVVVDEQHRFGVQQRLALRDKGRNQKASSQTEDVNLAFYPHQLIMTATPIPRTLMMTAYADLDCSTIDELPPGRTPVETVVIAENRRDQVVQRVHDVCRQGRQAYWVCTLIDESEALQCQAAATTAELLQAALADLKVGLIHGRMKSKEKAAVMSQFTAGEIDLLVATTVIEVGVDVPNATLMIMENAERLGLSQLHQLRGRVGRGRDQSHCVLLYKTPVSQLAKARLAVMRETNDGFEIAKRDLALRGPGEMLGTRQTGLVQFRIADLLRHQHLLGKISRAAVHLNGHFPDRVDGLIRRWIGDKRDYGSV